MAEIYLNSSDTNNTPLISTRLYDGGLPFNSDEEVTVNLLDIGNQRWAIQLCQQLQ